MKFKKAEISAIEKIMDEDAQEFIFRPGCKNEVRGLFFNGRPPVDSIIPEGFFRYDFRGNGMGSFCTIENKVVIVNHEGTLITKEEIRFPKEHPTYIYLKGRGGYTFGNFED